MKQIKLLFALAAFAILALSCKDEVKDKLIDFANDVTFNEGEGISITPDHLDFMVPDAPFKASAYHKGEVTMNVKKNSDGTHSGFALSNKNYRSYPWCTAKPRTVEPTDAQIKAAADTSIYSVFTNYPNQLKTFTVVRVDGDEAYFTIDRPRVVEHVLVANNNFNFLLLTNGSVFSSNLNAMTQTYQETVAGAYAVVRNPTLPDASASKFRVWYMPDYYDFGSGSDYIRLAGHKSIYGQAGYLKLIAKGYNGTTQTGESVYYLAAMKGVLPEPHNEWEFILNTWSAWDLSELGQVDKVVFYMDSSDKDAGGKMRTPPYFCLDGIRLSK